MFIEKNTYSCIEENKEKMLEDMHDYFKNIFFMKCLDQALGPTFPGNTSKERIQLLNVFYLNAFNSFCSEKHKIGEIKKALTKLIDYMNQDFRTNPDIFSKIMFICGMFKEHFAINLAGIPTNLLSYIHDNVEVYMKGVEDWNKE